MNAYSFSHDVFYSLGRFLSILFFEFFVAGGAESDSSGTSQQEFTAVFSVPELGMIGVAGYAGQASLSIKGHINGDVHTGLNIHGMRELFIIIITGEFFVAFAAHVSDLGGVGQIFAVKGQGNVAVKTFCLVDIIVNCQGQGRI